MFKIDIEESVEFECVFYFFGTMHFTSIIIFEGLIIPQFVSKIFLGFMVLVKQN